MADAVVTQKEEMQAELLRKAHVAEVKREADNEQYTRAIREMMFDVADDLRRTVARSEAMKAMDEEQAARAHSLYFKTYVAEFIAKSTEGKPADDPMVEVREELLREIGRKEAEVATKDEQYRRVMADFKHEISDEIRRAVAQQQARRDVEVEKAQRIQQERMASVGEELRRTVAASEVDKAAEVEQAQRVQADYFKSMVMGQISKNDELSASPSMKAVQQALLSEIAARKSD
eukprot:m.430865 g.430865  ORF g.430865 m.430865 type:complete len:233 (+) comp17221_c0_seq1:627-1325(+)